MMPSLSERPGWITENGLLTLGASAVTEPDAVPDPRLWAGIGYPQPIQRPTCHTLLLPLDRRRNRLLYH
jgi:hypothetical protein